LYSRIVWCSTPARASCVVVNVVARLWPRTLVNVSACPTASLARPTMSTSMCFQYTLSNIKLLTFLCYLITYTKGQSNSALGGIARNGGCDPKIFPSRGGPGPLSNRILLTMLRECPCQMACHSVQRFQQGAHNVTDDIQKDRDRSRYGTVYDNRRNHLPKKEIAN